jgi:hypothetical protein
LLNFGILKKLKELVQSPNTELKKKAVTCIAATTELGKLLSTKNTCVKEKVTLFFIYFRPQTQTSKPPKAQLHPELRQIDFIKLIVGLLTPEELPEIQEEAAFTLTNLAADGEFYFFPLFFWTFKLNESCLNI